MQFSKRLKELRNENNLTAKNVANNINISRSALSNYEQGTRQPDYETLIRIANFFEVTIDFLLGIEENSFKTNYNKSPAFSREEIELVEEYRQLNSANKRTIKTVLKSISKGQEQADEESYKNKQKKPSDIA